MEYNTKRNHLVIPEYGRNVQKLVKFACDIEDREKRTEAAHYIVNIMSNIVPQSKDQTDYKHKLWDFIYYISDYKLDVDGPYPQPKSLEEIPRPDFLDYKEGDITFRFYGRNLENMMLKAGEINDEQERQFAARSIANHMKKMYLNWNKEGVSDDIIIQHMAMLSNGKLILDISEKPLKAASDLIEKPEPQQRTQQNRRSGGKTRMNKRPKPKPRNKKY